MAAEASKKLRDRICDWLTGFREILSCFSDFLSPVIKGVGSYIRWSIRYLGVPVILLLSFIAAYPSSVPLLDPPPHLEVVGSLSPHDPPDDKWTLRGRVLLLGVSKPN